MSECMAPPVCWKYDFHECVRVTGFLGRSVVQRQMLHPSPIAAAAAVVA